MAKRDYFESMKDAGIFLGRENNRDFFGYCTFYQLKLTTSSIYCRCAIFWGYAKNVGMFLSRQILKLGFWGGIKYEPLTSDPPVIKISEWGPWDQTLKVPLKRNIFLRFCIILYV